MNQPPHYKDIAISKLVLSNYQVFLPLNNRNYNLVIMVDKEPKLCLVQSVKDTKRGPNIVFGDKLDFTNHDYLIAVEVANMRVWLIPVPNLDITKKSMMLTGYSQEYSLVKQAGLAKRVANSNRDIAIEEAVAEVVKTETVLRRADSDDTILSLLEGSNENGKD